MSMNLEPIIKELKPIARDCRALGKPKNNTSKDEQACWASVAKRIDRVTRMLAKIQKRRP